MAKLTRDQSNELYFKILKDDDTKAMKELCLTDLFFLLTIGFKRPDINHPWLYERCREVEASPDGHIDLWFREAYKSTIITFGKNVQDVLNDPEETVGIFSHTRPIAKKFLFQISSELENNKFLKDLFPDILYQDPRKESPRWSLDGGIILKRKTNPKEATFEAWGLVDGQPTASHFSIMSYDDVVVRESVTSPEMIAKTTEAIGISYNLQGRKGNRPCKVRFTGTRYHANDTYRTIIERGTAKPRYYYPTDKGRDDLAVEGKSILMSKEALLKKRTDMAEYVYGCQMLQNPVADKLMGFKVDWLMTYHVLKNYEGWNFYLLVDPAGEKKKTSDYTVMVVIGLAPDKNYYLVDGIRDRLNLTQRATALMGFHRKWRPSVVGYEKYGKDSDIEHIKYVQEQEGYRFEITPLGGAMPKNDRIRRLVPIFEQHRFYTPARLLFNSVDGKTVDFIKVLIDEEYCDFPVSAHDDMLDCIARITDEDLKAVFPMVTQTVPLAIPTVVSDQDYDPLNRKPQDSNIYREPITTGSGDWKDIMRK
jgi:predicted phage terminase large subunit-like protein